MTANRVHLIDTPGGQPTPGEPAVSPNGAYRFWVRQPETAEPGPWGAGLIVDTEQPQRPTLLFEQVAQPIEPRWINEKLIYVRVVWGRVAYSDLILDVEQPALIYHEQAIYGDAAFEQFQQACAGRCPCQEPAPEPAADGLMPAATPGDEAMIGLLAIPRIFGTAASAEGPRGAIPVYQFPEAGADKLREPDDPEDFESREYAYEAPGAVVYARRPGWFQVGMADASRAWVSDKSVGEYFPIDTLLLNHLAFLNRHWDGRLWESPTTYRAWNSRLPRQVRDADEINIAVEAVRWQDDGLWLQISTFSRTPCSGSERPAVVDRGWIPSYSSDGRLVAGFYSRGC
jgi:hypothetical protein